LRPDLKGVRIGVAVGEPFDQVEPEIARLLSNAGDVMRDLGADLVDTAVPDVMRFNDLQQILGKSEAAVICGRWMRERPGDMTFDAISVVQEGLLMPATRYLEAKSLRAPLLEAHVRAIYRRVDVLLAPVLAGPTPTIADTDFDDQDQVEELFTRSARFTRFTNYLGTPSLSVPCGFTDNGLPAAFQLHGPPFGEARLLAVAHAYQGATDHHTKVPPLG
jgi:aspartyl-tRNA(Asn)/glutamyl-tRNA(Gln) amidotransferase subunit A